MVAAVGVGGCGGDDGSEIPEGLGTQIAERAEAIADELEAGDDCAAADRASELVAETVAAINAGRVPDELQEELLGRANELADRIDCPGSSEPEAAPVARELAEWVRDRLE